MIYKSSITKSVLTIEEIKIPLVIRKNHRSRNLKITVKNSSVIISSPKIVPNYFIEKFIDKQKDWIKTHWLNRSESNKLTHKEKHHHFLQHKKTALHIAKERLIYFNQFYNLNYKKISIRNQSSRWGSCSKAGTLSFNYKIAILPSELADYIIVHELCHLQEFNHSPAFWQLVAKQMPNWPNLRHQLKKQRL